MIYTIGQGNRSIDEFLALLKQAGIECLVDVRAYPASRRHPQFGREAPGVCPTLVRQTPLAKPPARRRGRKTAIMCAERLPWECHRNLIADRLVAGGAAVMHLGFAADARPHRLSPEARVEDGVVIYDAGAQRRLELPDARPKGAA